MGDQALDQLTVMQVACKTGDLIYTMPKPARHNNIMNLAKRAGLDSQFQPDEQGFLLSDGSFADREEAYKVAKAAGQPWRRKPEIHSEHLFTEDLW